jgi:hypothetical protein
MSFSVGNLTQSSVLQSTDQCERSWKPEKQAGRALESGRTEPLLVPQVKFIAKEEADVGPNRGEQDKRNRTNIYPNIR